MACAGSCSAEPGCGSREQRPGASPQLSKLQFVSLEAGLQVVDVSLTVRESFIVRADAGFQVVDVLLAVAVNLIVHAG